MTKAGGAYMRTNQMSRTNYMKLNPMFDRMQNIQQTRKEIREKEKQQEKQQ